MKLSKRILSAFLAILMVCSIVTTVSAANVTFTDVSGHWAVKQIQYLVDKGVLNGYKQPNGTYTFNPNGEVTRAEFIKMLDATFGLKATTNISYSDVKTSDWFYPYFAMAAAQGYILNYGTSVNPNGKITREEALSLLVRYLDLPANEKASTTYFADYHTITEHYRDYVLRGIYAGLTDGYNENGVKVFKPQNTLTRAEALTILYRAAGCIFQTNAYSRDSGSADTNNIIAEGNVILNGINLSGRVIVSEGATSGIVSIYGCSIPDTLYIRGTADVVLDDSRVKNVVIENGCKLSIQNGTEIESVTVYGKSTINIYSGISLALLDIENGADDTNVSGDGAIRMAYINASGFRSSMTPAEFQIGNNLTATFAGTQYQGSSDAQESFTMTPFVTSDEANYYLNLFPAVDGTVYYYFTNGANPPTSASYDSYFDSSSFTGSINVRAGQVTTEKTYSASSVKDFEYVVLQLQDGGRKYAPVIIPNSNTEGNGFSTTPYLADDTTIKFVSAQAGTLYWFYAKDGSKLTQVEFMEEYGDTDGELRDEATVVSGRTLSIGLNTKYLKNYDYVALMIKAAGGSYYTPVIVSAGDNGFKVEPTLKNVGTISFTSAITGDLYYYYSKNSNLPTAEDFKGEYNAAKEAKNISVTKDKADTFDYDVDLSEDYPYLILSLRNSDKEYMQPVAISIDYRTGFRNAPEVVDGFEVRFRTEDDGEVMYYYTKTESVPTISEFHDRYDATGKSYKDTIEVRDSYETIDYTQRTAETYPYMALMFIDDQENEYSPVVVALNSASDHGFSLFPYIIGDTLYFTTTGDGEVWYYYDRTEYSISRSEYEEEYDNASSSRRGTENVTGGVKESITLDEDELDDGYTYIYMAFLSEDEVDDDDKSFYYPIVVDTDDTRTSGTGLTLTIGSESVTVTSEVDGEIRYYFSDSRYVEDESDFKSGYRNAAEDKKRERTVDAGDNRTIYLSEYDLDSDEDYLIICAVAIDSNDEYYFTPVVVDLKDGTSSSVDSDADFDQDGLRVVRPADGEEITLRSEYTGTVNIYIISTKISGFNDEPIDSKRITKDVDQIVDYSDAVEAIEAMLDGPLGSGGFLTKNDFKIRFQLETSDGKFSPIDIDID